MSAFTTLPRHGAVIPQLEPYFQGDSQEAGRYLAGRMLQPLFNGTDSVQMIAAALAVSTVLRLWRLRGYAGPGWLMAVAACLVLGAAALLASRVWLGMAVAVDLNAYWSAIASGNRPAATDAKALFDAGHRVAERLSATQISLMLAAVAAIALCMAPVRASQSHARTHEPAGRGA